MAVLRHVGEAARAQLGRVAVRHHGERLAVEEHASDGRVADAGEHLEQLRLAVAGDAGDADDLAGAHVEGHFREAADALGVDVAEILHLEQRPPRHDRLLVDAQQDAAADHQLGELRRRGLRRSRASPRSRRGA